MMTLNSALFLAAASQPPGPPAWMQMVPFILIFVIFYFIAIRPQQQRQNKLTEMIKSIQPGDKVVTNGGIIGIVVAVKEKSLTIRSADTKLELQKSAISEISERSGQAAQS